MCANRIPISHSPFLWEANTMLFTVIFFSPSLFLRCYSVHTPAPMPPATPHHQGSALALYTCIKAWPPVSFLTTQCVRTSHKPQEGSPVWSFTFCSSQAIMNVGKVQVKGNPWTLLLFSVYMLCTVFQPALIFSYLPWLRHPCSVSYFFHNVNMELRISSKKKWGGLHHGYRKTANSDDDGATKQCVSSLTPKMLTNSFSLLSRSYNSIPKHRFGSSFAEFIFSIQNT